MNRLKAVWRKLTSSLWFLPSLIAIGGAMLASILVQVDQAIGNWPTQHYPGLFGTNPAASNDMLGIVASSTINVVALVFSITIVVLTLASTQFSPRIVRTFMRDAVTQSVLGGFVGIFVYCLIVLRTIRTSEQLGGEFVPTLAVATGAVLGVVGMGGLIFFIHHIANSINASNVIASIAHETMDVASELYPHEFRRPSGTDPVAAALDAISWRQIASAGNGYIQSVDVEALEIIARERGVTIRLLHRVGEFVVEGLPLAAVSENASTEDPYEDEINACCDIDSQRTVEQDIAFGIRLIVDMALKALSPAVNDTTTALTCVDYLSAVCVHLVRRHVEPFTCYDEGRLMVFVPGQSVEDFLDLAFNQIRQNAGGNVAVMIRLLKSLEQIAEAAPHSTECQEIVASEVRMLADLARRTVETPQDRIAVEHRLSAAERTLERVADRATTKSGG